MPEHDGSSGATIDYEHWPLYRTLTHACAGRKLRIFRFGIGLDPLWLGTDMLAAIVIDSDLFDDVFSNVVLVNAEGQLVGGLSQLSIEGIPFRQEYVDRFLTSKPMGPGGAACLTLAWQHRRTLLDGLSQWSLTTYGHRAQHRRGLPPMFSIPRVNVIESDEGFSVEVLGRVGIRYTEGPKTMLVDSEVLTGPTGMVIYPSSITVWDPPGVGALIDDATRRRIVDNIRRAFRFEGFEIEVQ